MIKLMEMFNKTKKLENIIINLTEKNKKLEKKVEKLEKENITLRKELPEITEKNIETFKEFIRGELFELTCQGYFNNCGNFPTHEEHRVLNLLYNSIVKVDNFLIAEVENFKYVKSSLELNRIAKYYLKI